MYLIRDAMGGIAVAFGEDIAKGETGLGAPITADTLLRYSLCSNKWMHKTSDK
jgi:hypothetical protein